MSFSSRSYVLVTLFYLAAPCIQAEIIISPATSPSTPPIETTTLIIAAPERQQPDTNSGTPLPTQLVDTGIKMALKKFGYITAGVVVVGCCLYAAYQHIKEVMFESKPVHRQAALGTHAPSETNNEEEVTLDLSDEQRELVRAFALAVEAMDAQAIGAFDFDAFPVDVAVLLQWVQMNVVTLCADADNLDTAKQYCGHMVVALRGIADPESLDLTTLVEA